MDYPFVSCLNPRKIVNPYTHEVMTVRCGKCKACQNAKSDRLSFQCDLECAVASSVLFVTLTFDEKNLPRFLFSPTFDCDGFPIYQLYDKESGEYLGDTVIGDRELESYVGKKDACFGYLCKDVLQQFILRLRANVYKKDKNFKIRYFACGEYGPVHFRPHFHLLLFLPRADKNALISECIYTSWKLGRIDVQAVSGKASGYVASYVNGNCSLPSFLKIDKFKPFALHSWRLGQGYFEFERRQVYESSVDDFVRRSSVIDGKFKEYKLWRSCYAYFYPKCKGFDSKSSLGRTFTYRLYGIARRIFPASESTLDLARFTAFWIHSNSSYEFSGETAETSKFFSYFRSSARYEIGWSVESDEFQKFVYRIYVELLLSRHFLYFVCDAPLRSEINRKVSLIESFYKRLDYLHLRDFYESQCLYFESDISCPEDIPFFYDNVCDSYPLTDSLAYRLFDSETFARYNDKVKHKTLNDINKLLFD